MSTRDPKAIRDIILDIMRNTFAIYRADKNSALGASGIDAAMRHAAGNIAQWVFLEYVESQNDTDTTKS